MTALTQLAGRFFWISLTTSAILLPLLLLAKPIRQRYRAKSCYLLFLVLCLRLLIPLELPMKKPVVTVEVPRYTLVLPEDTRAEQVAPNEMSGIAPPARRSLSVPQMCALLWVIGAAAALTGQGGLYLLARRRLLLEVREDGNAQEMVKTLGGNVPVLRGGVDTPMSLGLLSPVILLPENLAEEDLPFVLRHELCHIRRGDLWCKALFLWAGALHWYNPLVWRLGKVAGENLEFCCDEAVVAGQDGQFRRRYGQVLLRSAAGEQNMALATQFGSGEMKGRLMNLFVHKKRGLVLVSLTLCAAVLSASLVGCQMKEEPKREVPAPGVSTQDVLEYTVPVTETADEGVEAQSGGEESGSGTPDHWIWPVEGKYELTALFGERTHPVTGQVSSHTGVDIKAEEGTEVLASDGGTVETSAWDGELGNYVLISHADGYTSLYGQLSRTDVQAGDTVEQGQVIGAVGKTGMATGAHLHYEVAKDGLCRNPLEIVICGLPLAEEQ